MQKASVAQQQVITPQVLKDCVGWAPDQRLDKWWVEVKTGIHTARDIRSLLVTLAYAASLDPAGEPTCVLVDSRMTPDRLARELQLFRSVIDPQVWSRIHVVLRIPPARFIGLPTGISEAWLEDVVLHQLALPNANAKGASQYTVLGLLILNWLQCAVPQTTESICRAADASYPTVAKVLKLLEAQGVILKESDRRVSLRKFPLDQWRRWVVASTDARKSVRFVDHSGQARSPEDLARRLQKLHRNDVAIGGVMGAKHHYPALDISGSLRLDLTVHGAAGADLSFVQRLDAALEPSHDLSDRPSVVVHFLTRKDSFFECDADGFVWADPLECMADLFDARLDNQADDMLRALIDARNLTEGAQHV